jgi:TolB-like protein/Tfp pilus assembly protein PilF
MGDESPKSASTPTGAVFLSYASQDAEAAQRICAALRSAGLEVWFDQSELRGGDAWDRQIRERLHDCRLFIAVISANTETRDEGYFRREWKLAVERTQDMSEKKAFLVPVVIDDTHERGASVPDKFHEVQWTRLPRGDTPPAFVDRVRHLLSPEPSHGPTTTVSPAGPISAMPPTRAWVPASWRSQRSLLAIVGAVALGGLAYLAINRFSVSRHQASQSTMTLAPANVTATAFAPPLHSIAVLPFVNLSGDPSQDYFSDGLTEELLNSLAEIEGLQVAARTSSFSFKEHPDIATVAHKLNVGAVLEGSVRRSEHTVRVTAQLINAVTGFHLWSKTYDRDLGDVLKLQTEIATAVANALRVTLLGDISAKIELGGTRNPAAFDAYLRATKRSINSHEANDLQAAAAGFTEAIRLDPHYALAFAGRSIARGDFASFYATGPSVRSSFDKARADADMAISLAPGLAEGRLALAFFFEGTLDFARATQEYDRALALAPGKERVIRNYGLFAVVMGQTDSGLAALRRAVALDPLGFNTHRYLGRGLIYARRYEEAVTAYANALALEPDDPSSRGYRGLAYFLLGDFQNARSSCDIKAEGNAAQRCLALAYDKLGRHSDAEGVLTRIRASMGDSGAFHYAEIYSQWGKPAQALEWLDTAMRMRNPWLEWVKTDPLLDPLRREPRFQAIERQLKFPQ